jgi:hypothetical protein
VGEDRGSAPELGRHLVGGLLGRPERPQRDGGVIREARLADPIGFRRRLPAILLLGGFYFFLVFGWGGWMG